MDDGAVWTLQQFTQVAGRPWYALHRQNDGGVLQSFTGYRHELAYRRYSSTSVKNFDSQGAHCRPLDPR